MVNAGAAVLLDEKELSVPSTITNALAALLNSPSRLSIMSIAARTQAHPGAAERIADRLAELGHANLRQPIATKA
jgi:UDP-N-acetylglucosamine--N-acetylmuramyl-(pentapeptide) pyrophosphoryl-undecaprenol N-acetylglucosamine transferase